MHDNVRQVYTRGTEVVVGVEGMNDKFTERLGFLTSVNLPLSFDDDDEEEEKEKKMTNDNYCAADDQYHKLSNGCVKT